MSQSSPEDEEKDQQVLTSMAQREEGRAPSRLAYDSGWGVTLQTWARQGSMEAI